MTAFLTFVRDPEEFFWRYVRRVPSPPSPAAQLGIELHRRIEQHARGVAAARRPRRGRRGALRPRPRRAPRRRGKPVSAEQMWAELPAQPLRADDAADGRAAVHALPRRGHLASTGRIDAIFEREDGAWEIVDYKTGEERSRPAAARDLRSRGREIWKQEAACKWLLLRDGREVDAPPIAELGQGHRSSCAANSRRRLKGDSTWA